MKPLSKVETVCAKNKNKIMTIKRISARKKDKTTITD